MVRLYLVRHGEATTEAENPARPLSARGRAEVERVARHLAAVTARIAEIRHSGALRARQTAEVLASHVSPARGLRETAGLRPTDDPETARAEVEAASGPLMLVGHLPHLGRLAASLVVGDAAQEVIRFEAGAVACLAKGQAGWAVEWVLTPEVATPVSGEEVP